MTIRSDSEWRAKLVQDIIAELEQNLPKILEDNLSSRDGFNVTVHFPPMAKSAKITYPPLIKRIQPEGAYE